MTESHEDWEARLGRLSAAADEWSARTNDAPATQKRSALGGDDQRHLHVSGLAWYSIVVAVEHLDFTLTAMRATSTLYPTAYLTSLRSALLSASHAVWVLAPNQRVERRARAMQLQVQDLRDQLAMVRGVFALTDEQSVLRDQDAARLQKRLDSCVVLASELGLPSAATARLNNTDVITWAAKHVHRQDEPLLASGVQLLWRTGSAAAHGQRSFAMTRLDRNSQRTDDGGTVMELRGDLARDVGPSAAAATFTISEALRLYDSRNGA